MIFNGLTADAADQDLKAFWLTKRVMRYSGEAPTKHAGYRSRCGARKTATALF